MSYLIKNVTIHSKNVDNFRHCRRGLHAMHNLKRKPLKPLSEKNEEDNVVSLTRKVYKSDYFSVASYKQELRKAEKK